MLADGVDADGLDADGRDEDEPDAVPAGDGRDVAADGVVPACEAGGCPAGLRNATAMPVAISATAATARSGASRARPRRERAGGVLPRRERAGGVLCAGRSSATGRKSARKPSAGRP